MEDKTPHLNLILNGDSNVYGEELVPDQYKSLLTDKNFMLFLFGESYSDMTDDDRLVCNNYRNNYFFGKILGKKLNALSVLNLAISGSSNDRIVRTTLEFIDNNYEQIYFNPENYQFIIGITSPNRNEFYKNETNTYINFCPTGNNEEVEYYFTRFSTDIGDADRSYKNILVLQNTFKQLKVKYKFFLTYGKFIDKELNLQHPTKYSNLLDKTNFIPIGMHEFLGGGYKKGPGFHYLEEGHNAWANFLESFL
jgi:hypothetical protein